MLKCITGFLFCLVVVLHTAYVPRAYATSASDIIITHIQAGASGAATHEFVALYNQTDAPIAMDGWCLRNKSAVLFACFESDSAGLVPMLPAGSSTVVYSQPLADTIAPDVPLGIVYAPTNLSSGSIIGSSDTISLLDAVGEVRDEHAWTTSLAAGTVLQRAFDTLTGTFIDSDTGSDWQARPLLETPPEGIEWHESIQEQTPLPTLVITELLPNASGADDGREFIELYNYGAEAIDLAGIILSVGPQFEKQLVLPAIVVNPQSYVAFTNGDLAYSLLNSSSRVQLSMADGRVIDQSVAYQDPKDDYAWALLSGEWAYTNVPTPGFENSVSTNPVVVPISSTPTLKPCATNQYRHPETNRCRLLTTSSIGLTECRPDQYRSPETNRCRTIAAPTTPTPCKPGQVRNLETNRCRLIATNTGPAPCKEGQERNPETNRCRTVKAMTNADYGVLGVKTASEPDQWYMIAAVAAIVLGLVGYAAWEWRDEVRRGLRKIRKFVTRA